MTVMEVGLISGNEADIDVLVKQVPTLKLVETKERKVILYFDEVSVSLEARLLIIDMGILSSLGN